MSKGNLTVIKTRGGWTVLEPERPSARGGVERGVLLSCATDGDLCELRRQGYFLWENGEMWQLDEELRMKQNKTQYRTLPQVARELNEPYDRVRYAVLTRVVDPWRVGRSSLFTAEQIEKLRVHFRTHPARVG